MHLAHLTHDVDRLLPSNRTIHSLLCLVPFSNTKMSHLPGPDEPIHLHVNPSNNEEEKQKDWTGVTNLTHIQTYTADNPIVLGFLWY